MTLKPPISDKSDPTEEKERALLVSVYKGSNQKEICLRASARTQSPC